MRAVLSPKVYLIARPMLHWGNINDYLEEVAGEEWAEKMSRTHPPDAEALIEFSGRLCYRSWAPGLNANVTKIREDSNEYLLNILKSGHGAVLEHANFSFLFQDVSRVFTHEQVRHRAGVAYSQESMRYVRLTDIPFWFPTWAADDSELMARCIPILHMLESHQTWMASHFKLDDPATPFHEKKHKTSFMRRFAPDGIATSILATINVRALRHIIYLRTSILAEEEIRLVYDQVAEIMKREIPTLMQDYSPNNDREWVPEFLKV